VTTIDGLSDSEIRFAGRVVARRRLFLGLAIAGVAIGAGLAAFYGWRWTHDTAFPIGPRAVIVLLVLLNARQNLRQYRHAGILRKMMGQREGGAPASS
jgi:predicted MFS family arabinose efflux permease